jgi:hypothetical protein
MDILTLAGQKTLKDEQRAADLFCARYPQFSYVQTPKDMPAYVDALLIDCGLAAAVETKCRYDMDLQKFRTEYNQEWLVTKEKITKASEIAAGLGIPLVGFLYLVPSDCLLVQKITDSFGNLVCNIRTQDTYTQRSINGGRVLRTNGFINMGKAKVLRGTHDPR